MCSKGEKTQDMALTEAVNVRRIYAVFSADKLLDHPLRQHAPVAMIEHVLTTRDTAASLVTRPVRWAAGAVDCLLLIVIQSRALPGHVAAALARQHLWVGGGSIALEG